MFNDPYHKIDRQNLVILNTAKLCGLFNPIWTGSNMRVTRNRTVHRCLNFLVVIGSLILTGCGGGVTTGVGNGGDIFDSTCQISDPGFPFCGGDWVRCRDQAQLLYNVFHEMCPAGWTVVPDDVPFPPLACTNPQGHTFNVAADQCPAGWKKFTITF